MATSISFDSNDLQTATILTAQIDEGFPQKNMGIFPLAHANGSKIPNVQYPNRTIRVAGKLIGTGITNMDALEDTFKAYFVGTDKNLDIGKNSTTRRYVATVNALGIERPGGLQYANFEIEFICTNPFGKDTSTTTALNATARTLSSYTDPYTFLGTAPTQQPVITYTLSALTGGTTKTVIIGNNGTGQAITVERTWTAADVLVIDTVNKTVKVNGTPVEFSGSFPEFATGAQNFSYSDTLTTRTFDINIVYTKMYL